MSHEILHPKSWKPAKGYANGVAARGRMVFTGGLIGWNAAQEFETDDFVGQGRNDVVWNLHICADDRNRSDDFSSGVENGGGDAAGALLAFLVVEGVAGAGPQVSGVNGPQAVAAGVVHGPDHGGAHVDHAAIATGHAEHITGAHLATSTRTEARTAPEPVNGSKVSTR